MSDDCTCGCCVGNRALSGFIGGGLLFGWVGEKIFPKGSNWPIYVAILGGLTMMLLLRHLDRRERRKKNV